VSWRSKWLAAPMCVLEGPGVPTDGTDKSPSVSFVSAPPARFAHTHSVPTPPPPRAAGGLRHQWVAPCTCRRCGAVLPPTAVVTPAGVAIGCTSCGEAHAARPEVVN